MADGDMPENGEPRYYQDPVTAQLGERVTNMGRRINDVEVEMRAGFSQLGSNLAASTNETRQAISALSTSLAERNRPQYQALGFGLSVILAVGALAYWPMRESTNDLKARNGEISQAIQTLATETNKTIQGLAANTVSRQEMDWRSARGTEDRNRSDEQVASMRESMVYRNEWQERNLSRDHDIENIRSDAVRDVANLQRQLDQQRADFQIFSNSLGNGRDFIIDLKNEQSRLRDQIAALTAKVAAEAAVAPR